MFENLVESRKFYGIHLISFFIAISMNLFDQLVIVICNSNSYVLFTEVVGLNIGLI